MKFSIKICIIFITLLYIIPNSQLITVNEKFSKDKNPPTHFMTDSEKLAQSIDYNKLHITCSRGASQSPINIIVDKNTAKTKNHVKIKYKIPENNSNEKFFFDGNKLILDIKLGKLVYSDFDSDSKEIFIAHKLQIIFPSEHYITRNGITNRNIIELQIFHKLLSTNQVLISHRKPVQINNAIVSILFNVGTVDEGDSFFNAMGISKQNVDQDGVYNTPKKMENLDHNPKQLPPATYDVGFNYVALQGLINLINSNSEMFFYNGSLTTAPCNEDVLWMIFGEPRTISKFQFDYLKKFMVMSNDTKKIVGSNKKIVVKIF